MPDASPHAGDFGLRADRNLLAEAARDAGPIAMGYFRADPEVWMKAGNSPVSEADLAVDTFLKDRLMAARPEYGWLSEETADDPRRLDCVRVFVVDPIDGTRGFLAGVEDWAISVAVVENGRPVAAALYQPATGSLMTAHRDGGAEADGVGIAVSGQAELAGARMAVPRKALDAPALTGLGISAEPHLPSLALRVARVAQGRIDVALATGNAHDWDIAAADLILEEAGGALRTLSGDPVRYNAAVPRHEPLVATSRQLEGVALALLRDLQPRRSGGAP